MLTESPGMPCFLWILVRTLRVFFGLSFVQPTEILAHRILSVPVDGTTNILCVVLLVKVDLFKKEQNNIKWITIITSFTLEISQK